MKKHTEIKPAGYRKLSDEELVRRYIELHEYNAYNALFERFGHTVFGVCLSLHVGDAATARMKTEELFIMALRDIKPLKAGGFKPWLYNYIIHAVTGMDGAAWVGAESMQGGRQMPVSGVIPQPVADGMKQLSANEQLCIRLFYEGNKTLAQIANETGMPLQGVKALLHSAKEHIGTQAVSSKLAHIFDKSACLTRRQISEYAGGHTEAEESHAIEHHLNNCPLCSMAVEGMQLYPSEAAAELAELNNRFLHDHFSISYPQVQASSLVADGSPYRRARMGKMPLWAQLLLGTAVAAAIVVFFYVEKHKLHIPCDGFK